MLTINRPPSNRQRRVVPPPPAAAVVNTRVVSPTRRALPPRAVGGEGRGGGARTDDGPAAVYNFQSTLRGTISDLPTTAVETRISRSPVAVRHGPVSRRPTRVTVIRPGLSTEPTYARTLQQRRENTTTHTARDNIVSANA